MATATINLDKKTIDAIAERVVELLLKKGQNIISITQDRDSRTVPPLPEVNPPRVWNW